MDKTIAWLIALVGIVGVLSLLILLSIPKPVDENALANQVTAQVVSKIPAPQPVPTAAEIAALIPTPQAPVIPEFKSDQKVDEVWKQVYADKIEELNTKAYDVAVNKLEDHNYRLLNKWFEANVADFDELGTVTVKDYNATAVNLGLNKNEDKVATIDFKLRVKYTLLDGIDSNLVKTVHATATVTFDKGDFTDENVDLTFA